MSLGLLGFVLIHLQVSVEKYSFYRYESVSTFLHRLRER